MYRQSPPRRKGVLKHGNVPSAAMSSSSGTAFGSRTAQPADNNRKPRSYASETQLSTINQTGKFNYDLKRTGFLSEAKMRARRIAQNPKRFLEEYAERHDSVEIVPTEVPELESFIDKLSVTEHYAKKEKEMIAKAEAAKSRAFLLSMASASPLDMETTDGFINSYSAGSEDGDRKTPEHVNTIVSKYLEELKSVNTNSIREWLMQFYDLKDLSLPYGLPDSLRIPVDPTILENSDTSEFLETAHDNFLLLDGTYHAKLEEVTKELKTNMDCIHGKGWGLQDTATLFYVFNALDTSSVTANFTPLQLELATRLFPGKSQKAIVQQKYRLKTKKALEEKRASIIRTWAKDKAELEAKVNAAWQEVNKKRLAEMEKKISLRKQAELCLFWAEQVEKMRKEKCAAVRKIRILMEPAEKFRENMAKSIAEREAERRKETSQKLYKYTVQKWEAKVNAYCEREQKAKMMEEQLKAQSAANKARISYRRDKWTAKDRERRRLEEALEEERRRRAAELESIKEPVEIEYDPASVVQDTHCSMVRRVTTLKQNKDPDECGLVPLFREVYSFTADAILKDRRVRVEAKLREAGLLNSTYARQVLLAMQPKNRPHLASQIKFDD